MSTDGKEKVDYLLYALVTLMYHCGEEMYCLEQLQVK